MPPKRSNTRVRRRMAEGKNAAETKQYANTKENGGGEKYRRNEVIREYEGEWRRGKMPPKRSNTRIQRILAEGKNTAETK